MQIIKPAYDQVSGITTHTQTTIASIVTKTCEVAKSIFNLEKIPSFGALSKLALRYSATICFAASAISLLAYLIFFQKVEKPAKIVKNKPTLTEKKPISVEQKKPATPTLHQKPTNQEPKTKPVLKHPFYPEWIIPTSTKYTQFTNIPLQEYQPAFFDHLNKETHCHQSVSGAPSPARKGSREAMHIEKAHISSSPESPIDPSPVRARSSSVETQLDSVPRDHLNLLQSPNQKVEEFSPEKFPPGYSAFSSPQDRFEQYINKTFPPESPSK